MNDESIYQEKERILFIERRKRTMKFKDDLSSLLKSMEYTEGIEKKKIVYLKILDTLDNHADVIYNGNDNKWNRFINTVDKKLSFFIKKEKHIEKETKEFMNKYYRCRVVSKNGNRCKNKIKREISNCFCGVHKNYLFKFKFCLSETTNFDNKIIDKISSYLY